MAHSNTILRQFLALFPRHEFEKIRRAVQPKVHPSALSAWTQCGAMLSGQLAGQDSLRGMVDALAPQGRKLYHLGMNSVRRASLARANERTPAALFERVFAALLTRCREFAPRATKKFRFKDSGKGAVKLRIGLSADGYLPEFEDVTAGKAHETKSARELRLPRGS